MRAFVKTIPANLQRNVERLVTFQITLKVYSARGADGKPTMSRPSDVQLFNLTLAWDDMVRGVPYFQHSLLTSSATGEDGKQIQLGELYPAGLEHGIWRVVNNKVSELHTAEDVMDALSGSKRCPEQIAVLSKDHREVSKKKTAGGSAAQQLSYDPWPAQE